MVLDATTKSLQIILGTAVTTNQLPVVASYADLTTTTFLPGSNDTQSNSTTAVTIVAAPAASTQRQIKMVTIYNADTTPTPVVVRLNNNSTYRTIVSVTLKVGQTLQFAENAWSVIDSTGGLQESGGGTTTAAGSDGQIQFNNGGTVGGDPNLTWDDTNQIVKLGGSTPSVVFTSTTGAPPTPSTGNLALFSRTIANRQMAAQVSATGAYITALQPSFARNKVGFWSPSPSNATPTILSMAAFTGTAGTARTVATTSNVARLRRIGYSYAGGTAGQIVSYYQSAAAMMCGSGSADNGGFFYVIRWSPTDTTTVSGERNFFGLSNTTGAAPTNVDPASLTNQIGVAQLSTDATQLYMVYGGTTAQTSIPLGTNFPAATLGTTLYELAIYAPALVANTYYYQVTNVSTGNVATGTLTGNATQVPQNTTLLASRNWATNNAATTAFSFDIVSMYQETDN